MATAIKIHRDTIEVYTRFARFSRFILIYILVGRVLCPSDWRALIRMPTWQEISIYGHIGWITGAMYSCEGSEATPTSGLPNNMLSKRPRTHSPHLKR